MKTWRERIDDARERRRGWRGALHRVAAWCRMQTEWPFTPADITLAWGVTSCAGGEVRRVYGLRVSLAELGVSDNGRERYLDFPWAVGAGNVERAEALLNEMEDRALELKREWSC